MPALPGVHTPQSLRLRLLRLKAAIRLDSHEETGVRSDAGLFT